MELPDLTSGGYKVLAFLSMIGAVFWSVVISTPFFIFGRFDCQGDNDMATMKVLPIEGWCCSYEDPTASNNEACIEWDDFGSTYATAAANTDFLTCYATAGCLDPSGATITFNTPGDSTSGIASVQLDGEIGERWNSYSSLTAVCLALTLVITVVAILSVFLESLQKLGQWLYIVGSAFVMIFALAAIAQGQQEDSALVCSMGNISEAGCSGRFSSTYTSAIFCYIGIAQMLWCLAMAWQVPKQCKCCCIDVVMRKEERVSMNPNPMSEN